MPPEHIIRDVQVLSRPRLCFKQASEVDKKASPCEYRLIFKSKEISDATKKLTCNSEM